MGEQEPETKPHVTLDDVWRDDSWTPANFSGANPEIPTSQVESTPDDSRDAIAVVTAISKVVPRWD